jgi:DNA-binding transcriptional regulator GbsR (MarR family)
MPRANPPPSSSVVGPPPVSPKVGAGGSSGLVLAAERPAETVAFETQVVDFFVGAADLLGVPKSVAAIYGIVFASAAPLSFAEIESRLDISKGSVSTGLRVLREIGALKEVSAATDRAELFTPDLEMRKLAARFLETRLKRQLESGSSQLAQLGKAIPSRPASETAALRTRLKSLQDWHSKARALLPIAKAFLKLGA